MAVMASIGYTAVSLALPCGLPSNIEVEKTFVEESTNGPPSGSTCLQEVTEQNVVLLSWYSRQVFKAPKNIHTTTNKVLKETAHQQ